MKSLSTIITPKMRVQLFIALYRERITTYYALSREGIVFASPAHENGRDEFDHQPRWDQLEQPRNVGPARTNEFLIEVHRSPSRPSNYQAAYKAEKRFRSLRQIKVSQLLLNVCQLE